MTNEKRGGLKVVAFDRSSFQGWEFPTKNNSAEDGIDGTNGYF
jgi:hypothetical protein